MESAHELQCGPLRINLRTEQVWRGTEALHLRPKSFAVLRYLIERAGRFSVQRHALASVLARDCG